MVSLTTQIPASEWHETLEVLGRCGVTREHLREVRGNGDRLALVVGAIIGTDSAQPDSVAQARGIMGKFFFGAEEWKTHYDVATPEVPEFPWSPEVLNLSCPFVRGKKAKDTHFAFLGLSEVEGEALSLMKLNIFHPSNKQPKFFSSPDDAWYRKQPFATDVAIRLRWYLLLKSIVPGSESKTWDQQLSMLPVEYEAPTAVEEAGKDVFCYKTSRTYLNRERYARTSDTTSYGFRVDVGSCDPYRVVVDGWDDGPGPNIGVAASRKLPVEP